MKASVVTKSGPPEVLKLKEVEKPNPRAGEVLVKVYAGTVTIGDTFIRRIPRLIIIPLGKIFGFSAHKISGHEFAGVIEAVGEDVTIFKAGDEVFGTTTGLTFGANAEYVCVPERWKQGVIALKPANITFDEAAAVPIGGMTALQILRKGNIKSGQKVLIYGASGSVGTYAVQIAKAFGAKVTGVCSTANIEMIKSIGADSVIDYKKEDFRKSGETYDVVFDTVRKIKKSDCKNVLKKDGVFISTRSGTSEETDYLNTLKELIEGGKLKPVIDRTYPLEDIVEAHRYVEKGHKKGNVVITVAH